MYRKILIASDPEGLAEPAVPAVAALARGTNATVRVVAVEETSAPEARYQHLVERLDQIVDELRHRGVSAEGFIETSRRDRVADHLAAAAEEWGADLIVLGSHRRGELRSLFVGSVGHALAARTRAPLLFVGSERAEAGAELPPVDQRRVLVGIDYDQATPRAVQAAIGICGPQTPVHVLHVQTLPGPGSGEADLPEDVVARDREAGHYLVEGALQQFADRGIHPTWQIFQPPGEVARVIVRVADDFGADVIVLGSRRLPTAWALVAGSVAHDVIASTTRRVLLAGSSREPARARETVPAEVATKRRRAPLAGEA